MAKINLTLAFPRSNLDVQITHININDIQNNPFMESLIFKYRFQNTVRIIVTALLFLAIVLSFIISGWSDMRSDIVAILLLLFYIINFFVRSVNSRIGTADNCLNIKWVNWFMKKAIPDTEIEKIILARLFVTINRIGKKPVRLTLESLEKDDKTRLYKFLIDYSTQKNIILERQPTP